MNDTRSTHRSRVPQRSSGRINEGVTTVEDERTRPGLYFVFCVWQSSVRGCRFTFVFILLLKCLNVRRFPPLSSPIYELCYKRAYLSDLQQAVVWPCPVEFLHTCCRCSLEPHYLSDPGKNMNDNIVGMIKITLFKHFQGNSAQMLYEERQHTSGCPFRSVLFFVLLFIYYLNFFCLFLFL